MADPFLGEIRVFSFGFPPRGWAMCNGQLLPINQNQALFALLGTTFGGDGRVTFALPEMRGRVPIHPNATYPVGSRMGEESHALSVAEMPAHTHGLRATAADATEPTPGGNVPALAEDEIYAVGGPPATFPDPLSSAGSGQPHGNLQPFLTLNFCIALTGIFPSRN